MPVDITPIMIIGAGLGGALSSIVGYYSSASEHFDGKKFTAGVIRGIITGLLVLITIIGSPSIMIGGSNEYTPTELFAELPNLAFLIAFLSGYVGDNIMNKTGKILGIREEQKE
ncbi:MAG: hypothetical protein QXI43_00040 [Candidatus Nitrosocaldus sp.]